MVVEGPDYFIVDIETYPINPEEYEKLDEEGKKKLLNPIDSKIVAIGIRYGNQDIIIQNENEKQILEDFWTKWRTIKKGRALNIVGFNIKDFDIPFIVTRSFIHNVIISPFTVKYLIDLREKVSAYRYGQTRGKLKEFGHFMGLDGLDTDGSDVFELYKKKDYEGIANYLKIDLSITDKMHKRIKDTRILEIERW